MGQDVSASPSITIDDMLLEVIDHFTYLGCAFTKSLLLDMGIDKYIAKAATVTGKLSKLAHETKGI